MKQDNYRPVRIPAAEARQLMPWQLPMMDVGDVGEPFKTDQASSQVVVTEEDIEAEKLTLADIEEIRENAAKEGFSQGHQEGFEQGYSEGKQQGHDQAFKAGEKEVKRRLALLEQLTQVLSDPISSQEQQLETLMIDLIQQFAKAVISAELKTDIEPLKIAVKAALAELPSTVASCEVHLHPDDLLLLESLSVKKGVAWVANEDIQPGGCQIHSDTTHIDNTVNARFDQIAAQLTAALGKTSASKPD